MKGLCGRIESAEGRFGGAWQAENNLKKTGGWMKDFSKGGEQEDQ